ncbi:MAG: peptidoglycan DD-metalloendopeptidase family protein [Casimicrobiaceae bacterium]
MTSIAPLARRIIAFGATAVVLAGCATRMPAPVIERTPLGPLAPPAAEATPAPPAVVEAPVPTYTVKRGDTLRVIAQDKGIDYRQLAAWNNIDNPDRLAVGQVLRLGPPSDAGNELPVPGPSDVAGPGVVTAPLREVPPVTGSRDTAAASAGPQDVRNADNYKSSPKAIKLPYSADAQRDFDKLATGAPAASAAAQGAMAPTIIANAAPSSSVAKPPSPAIGGSDEQLDWMWPAKGRIIGAFSETANLKGIDIAGTAGTPVVASAAGKVVYAGSGLRGYGKLVIIKHNDTYLSAYAHNRAIVVKEGDTVARGQKIAEMGNSDADQVKLHFEIRRLGKPMDPAKFLPPA